jgi:hypothetical protein
MGGHIVVLNQFDSILERFCDESIIEKAQAVLRQDEQSEEAFLGAQGVLLLCGLL